MEEQGQWRRSAAMAVNMMTTEKGVVAVLRTKGLKDPKLRNHERLQSRAEDSGPLGLDVPAKPCQFLKLPESPNTCSPED